MKRSLVLLLLACGLAFVLALGCHERHAARFPHRLHLARLPCGDPGTTACLSCADCHRSGTGSEPAQPAAEQCVRCHERDAQTKLRQSSRPSFEALPLASTIEFDHTRHLSMNTIKGQCVNCHSGALELQSQLFPPMSNCLGCHEHQTQFDNGQCQPCHDAGEVRKLRPVTFMRHDHNWIRHHSHDANKQPELCESCHSQSECDDCHDVTQGLAVETRRPELMEANFVHRADFLTRHAIEARSQPATCLTCHVPATCDGCHVERGVSASTVNAANPHPPGWAFGNPRSSNFHGRAARRDILSCASCHDQGPATNCIGCHRVGGPGGNPHPAGFWSSRSEGSAMCRYCHE